jgi:hypothetical protein
MRYDPTMTMREARARYFEDNHFGDDGGYSSPWVDFKLGPIPMPFPNTQGRVRAVRYHDLHHIVTEYATDTLGEFEISAWELGAGCKGYLAAWQLNLGGLAAGVMSIPRRTFRAFVRGRRARSLYDRDYDALLDRTVGDVTAEIAPPVPTEASASDVALFAIAFLGGLVAALPTFGLLLVGGPLLFLASLFRPAAPATT